MTCYQSPNFPSGFTTTGRTSYATEADCLNACKEGACCQGTTCSIKPQCQCQGTGKTFVGIGTTCTTNPCGTPCLPCCVSGVVPRYLNVNLITSVTGIACRLTTPTTTAGSYPDYAASRTVTLSKAGGPQSSQCYTWTFSEDFEADWYAAGTPFRTEPLSTYITLAVMKNCSGSQCALQWSVSQAVLFNGIDSGRNVLFNGATCGTTAVSDGTGGQVLSTPLPVESSGTCFGSLPSVTSTYAITSSGSLWNAAGIRHDLSVSGVQW